MATTKVPEGFAKITLKLRYSSGSTELTGMVQDATAHLITILSFSKLTDEQKVMRDTLLESLRAKP